MRPIEWKAVGFVWGFNLMFLIAQEICKLGTYWVFNYHYSFKSLGKQVYSSQYLTDSFLQFATGFGSDQKSIVTRRSQIAVKDSLKP